MLEIQQQAFDEFTVRAIAPPLETTITKAGSIGELCAIIRHYYTKPHGRADCPLCRMEDAGLAASLAKAKE